MPKGCYYADDPKLSKTANPAPLLTFTVASLGYSLRMTGMKIQIRNTPSYLKGLAETRARADADVLRLQKIHDEIVEKLAEATAERNSCDCLIRKFDERLDPTRIKPIRAWKNRYGPRGELALTIYELLQAAWPEAITTLEVAWAVQQKFKIDFLTKEERTAWLKNSVRRKLNFLVDRGVVERLHVLKDGATKELGRWRLKPQAGTSLDALRAAAGTAGVGVQQEVKRRGRPPKAKPVAEDPTED